jgi:hypothetical protein
MASNTHIDIDRKSLQQLNMNMDQFSRELNKVCKEALSNLGARIVADAQARLQKNDSIASSKLINCGRTAEAADGAILAGFPSPYAYYVEFGRRAGKWPPFRFIYQWVREKHLTKREEEEPKPMARPKGKRQKSLSKGKRYNPHESIDDEAMSIAYAIQRSIGEKGTKKHPFLYPAFRKNKGLLQEILKRGAAKVMNKDYTR